MIPQNTIQPLPEIFNYDRDMNDKLILHSAGTPEEYDNELPASIPTYKSNDS